MHFTAYGAKPYGTVEVTEGLAKGIGAETLLPRTMVVQTYLTKCGIAVTAGYTTGDVDSVTCSECKQR